MSLATPQLPSGARETANVGNGLKYTLLRANDGTEDRTKPRLFEDVNFVHPYRRLEPLSKLFNNVTTRSNVFAVWVTVGFFEVLDDTVRPVKLGPEIGRADNQHKRFRMFAIIDRTQAGAIPRQMTTLRAAISAPPTGTPGSWQPIPLAATNGTAPNPPANTNIGMPIHGGFTWQITDGMSVVLSPGTANEETVLLRKNGPNFEAYCTKGHAANSSVAFVGTPVTGYEQNYVYAHPGPQPQFTARQYPSTVLYFTLID